MLTLTCPSRDELLAYAAGRLPDETSEGIAAHLDFCPDCQAGLVTLEDTEDTFVAELRQTPATDAFLEESQCQVAVARARSALGTTGETQATAAGRSLCGTILGEYELIAELGHGGMGTVYKALHTKLGRVVALKVLTTGRTQDPRAITRFEREMLAIGKLDHHHIVRAYDAREIDGTPVLVMEYIKGLDLTEIVPPPRPVADRRRLRDGPAGGSGAAICPRARPGASRHQALKPDVNRPPFSFRERGRGQLSPLARARERGRG